MTYCNFLSKIVFKYIFWDKCPKKIKKVKKFELFTKIFELCQVIRYSERLFK